MLIRMGVKRTTLDIRQRDAGQGARKILGTRGIRDTVDEALREVVRREAGDRLMTWLKENEDLRNPEGHGQGMAAPTHLVGQQRP